MDEKQSYLTSCIVRSNVHRKRKRKEASKKDRSCSYEYWFPDPNETMNTQGYNIRVCQQMFLSTLGISATIVKTAFNKLEYVSGITLPDQRGTHQNNKKVEWRREQKVIEHIKSFKVVESHT